ncbi:MAG: hypothetical protein Q9191_003765 [Dirinaria sp. TL-2023a]
MQGLFAIFVLIAAVQANPVAVPQAVTAAISPSVAAPPGCTNAFSGTFGIAVYNLSTSAAANKKREVATQVTDGQIQAETLAPVSVISDGQIQAAIPTTTIVPIEQIGDGQIQAHTTSVVPVSQISDGQIQAHATSVVPVTQISDGQVQALATSVPPVTQIGDGQPQAPTAVSPTSTAAAVSQISDAQVEAPTSAAASSPPVATDLAATEASDAQISEATPSAPLPDPKTVVCQQESSLALTLDNGVLKDTQGRTGYIASNYQLQFDAPPQAGAIYTSGFTVCANGTLALGGSNVFYQCLSGDFYNLYDRSWAAQCSPVSINTVELVSCS